MSKRALDTIFALWRTWLERTNGDARQAVKAVYDAGYNDGMRDKERELRARGMAA